MLRAAALRATAWVARLQLVKAIVLALVLGIGCSGTFGERARRSLPVVNATALAVSTAALLVDAAQTHDAAEHGWLNGRAERNPLMGSRPGTREVEIYFGSAILINAALWFALPSKWRSILPGFVIGAQARTITGNLEGTCVAGFGRCPKR